MSARIPGHVVWYGAAFKGEYDELHRFISGRVMACRWWVEKHDGYSLLNMVHFQRFGWISKGGDEYFAHVVANGEPLSWTPLSEIDTERT